MRFLLGERPMGQDAEGSRKAMEQSMLDAKLQETGEKERLKEYITSQLNESGWREELKKQCVQFIQDKGVEKVSLEDVWKGHTTGEAEGRSLQPLEEFCREAGLRALGAARSCESSWELKTRAFVANEHAEQACTEGQG
eukprot:s1444_g2.t1